MLYMRGNMSIITRFNTLALTFFLFSFSAIFAESLQYENKIIEKIEIVRDNSTIDEFDASAVKSKIKTKEGDHFSQTEFDSDLKVLSQNFDRVFPEIITVDQKIHILLKVREKPTIRTIFWTGNCKIKTTCLEEELGIRNNSVLDRKAFNKAFHKLKAYYVKEGFFEAALEYCINENEGCNEVNIEISIVEGRAGRIKNIIYSGLNKCEKKEIEDLVVSKTYNLFMSWFTNEGTYNEDAVMQDQFTILNYLQNKGYADAKVNIEVCQAEEANRITLFVKVEKGLPYTIGEISFEGNAIFCDDDIWEKINLKRGSCYSPEAIRATATAITSLYGKCGYIDALVDYEPRLICDECVYSLHFQINEGEAYRVGLIKVLGNCTTFTNVILHETLLVPGELFNSDKLSATETRLKNVGYFESVNVYAVKTDSNSGLGGNYRDVHVEVSEGSTGQIGASGGYSTTEKLFGSLNLTENNFNYKGLSRVWSNGLQAIRGGGEYANITATFGQKSRSYILSWTKPYFMDSRWSVGFEIENSSTRYISEQYNILANGFTLHATNQLNVFTRVGYHYRLRNTDVHLSNGKKLSRQEREQLHSDGIISALGLNLVYDSTDHPLRPMNGYKSRLESELAGFGGDYQFFALAYLNSLYYQLDKDSVIKFQGDFKSVTPILQTTASRIPIDERLFLGGDNTLRGFKPYKVGPKFKNKYKHGKLVTKGGPKGGMCLQFLSVEASRRLMSKLDAFIYCDSGHLSFHNLGFGRMYTAAGFGVRVQIFPGSPPLQFGIGFPFNAKSKGQEKQFFLNVGGKF